MTKLGNLPTTVDDARTIQEEMIMVFGVDPQNITLLATEKDAEKILKHIKIDDKVVQTDKHADGSVRHREYF